MVCIEALGLANAAAFEHALQRLDCVAVTMSMVAALALRRGHGAPTPLERSRVE
jgi:hypothetical protein